MAATTSSTPDLAGIDLLNRDVFAERVPHDWFARLRAEAPVLHHPEPDGPGFWVFTSHRDVAALNRDWHTFSSEHGRGGVVTLEELTPEEQARRDEIGDAGRLMLEMDPPDHTRFRKLLNRGFTPKVIRSLEDHLREMSVRIVDRAMSTDDGRCDFVVDVAAELPLEAIAEFLGVPFEDRHRIFDWSNRLIGADDPEYAVTQDLLNEALVNMFMYANDLGNERRADPRNDIVSKLIHEVVDGDQLTEMDFNQFFLLLSVAGNETTRNALSHGMAAFLDHPEQYRMLCDDPSLIDGAVEEILRWASPVMFFRRNVTTDTEYEGHLLREGDKISLWYISANRDETVFADPYTFDITRDPNPHIAFGGGGPHFCLGANLARMEIKLLFEALIEQAPSIEQLGAPERLRSNFINGIKHLPVRLSR